MGRGATRIDERIQASLGKNICPPKIEFKSSESVTNGGVIFALPALLMNGLLKWNDALFKIPKGFYQLTSIFILLSFVALARIKNTENIRNYSPGELGKLLGLDRIPEVKTLREKITEISKQNNAEKWSQTLSTMWMQDNKELSGFFYVDGHVKVYHGKKVKLQKQYVARERLCLPGTNDFWVNDKIGQPFFVVNTEIKKGMLTVLKDEIVPRLLKDVPDQLTNKESEEKPYKSRFSIIFDREGYSPSFFKEMWNNHKISCFTYKKYVKDKWDEQEFIEYKNCQLTSGDSISIKLAERGTYYKKEKFWIREIRKLSKDGHQTSIITTNFDGKIEENAVLMFSRWSQENFFKYMRQHFGIDRLTEYGGMDIDGTNQVLNPTYKEFERQIKTKNSQLSKTLKLFGEINLIDEPLDKEKLKKYEIEKSILLEKINELKNIVEKLKDKKKKIDKHIDLSELPPNERYGGLLKEKKHIMDLIKMIAYRAETAMSIILKEVMGKPKESRFILRQLFQSEANIKPDFNNKILEVAVHNFNNENTDKSIKFLCEKLNETETIFPGTDLRLFFKLVTS
jgi:hypothetical protein